MPEVRLYFDLVSPYVFLALERWPEVAPRLEAHLVLRPVVYGAVLDRTGLVGPVEVPAKRAYTFRDVRRCAAILGVRVEGPPTHPFRSLEALRAICLQPEDRRLDLATALARACWRDGRDLGDVATIAAVMEELGADTVDLPTRLADPATKAQLAASTDEAIEAGVFGVPTFRLNDELFWGHDRIDHLAARIAGTLAPPDEEVAKMLARPAGVTRRRAPGTG